MKYIGIDISKASFVAVFPQERGYRTETFSNDAKGIRKLIGKLDSHTHHRLMETTGNYCFLLLYLLEKASIPVSYSKIYLQYIAKSNFFIHIWLISVSNNFLRK